MVPSSADGAPGALGTPSSGPAALARALAAVDQALDAPRRPGIPLGNWRWLVRQRITGLRELLAQESGTTDDGWLASRGGGAFAERNLLLARIGALGQEVLDTPDVERTRTELKRLLGDVGRHLQQVRQDAGRRGADGP